MATKNIGTRKAPKNTPALLMKQLEREKRQELVILGSTMKHAQLDNEQ